MACNKWSRIPLCHSQLLTIALNWVPDSLKRNKTEQGLKPIIFQEALSFSKVTDAHLVGRPKLPTRTEGRPGLPTGYITFGARACEGLVRR